VKDILYPYHCENEEHGVSPATGTDMAHAGSLNMDALEKRLRMNRLFGRLSTAQLRTLLAESEVKFAFAGDILVMESDVLGNHLMLVDGILEAQRIWTTQEGIGKSHTWRMKPEDTMGTFGILVASTRNVRVRAVTNIRYIEIDADMSDGFLSLAQQLSEEVNDDPVIHSRMQLLCHVSALSHLPLQNMSEVLKRFAGKPVKAGEIIVTQGEEGDAYYVIEDGQARVVKTDPFTDNTATVDYMGPGDAFGEEALLQGGYRNATINMTTPGNLLVLTKTDFDELVEPVMAQEVDAEQARKQINGGSVKLIDCRYDMEFEESRIPGAIHVALDRIRCDLHKFEPDTEYIVYCRSGRRSLAATFLLGERNIKAVSLKGGIKEWPFDVDARPIESPESEMPDPDGPAAV
jgi:rhodanese-related sulfurtransferase